MEANSTAMLTQFVKVMANETRLRIAGLLIDSARTSDDLARALNLPAADVLEHLAALRGLGVVASERREGSTVYGFNVPALVAMNRALLSRENIPTPVDDLEDEAARKALRPFFDGDRITALPPYGKKFQMLIEWLVTHFDSGVRYTEQEVNAIITQYHGDYATLRRAMIDAGLMEREHGIYWRV